MCSIHYHDSSRSLPYQVAEHEYVIHMKDRVFRETGDFSSQLFIEGSSGQLVCAGYYTEPFSQDGQNGGDYVIVGI